MNIFVLDYDLDKCVKCLVNSHCSKMVLETAQLLCSTFEQGTAPYRRTHYNHPCSKWVRESKQNYEWLIEYGEHLHQEFIYRYNKPHKSSLVIEWCKNEYQKLNLPDIGLTAFAQAMPAQYRNNDVVKAYQHIVIIMLEKNNI